MTQSKRQRVLEYFKWIYVSLIVLILSSPSVSVFTRNNGWYLLVYVIVLYIVVFFYYEKIVEKLFYIILLLLSLDICVYYYIFHIWGDTEWYYTLYIIRDNSYRQLLKMNEPLYYAIWPIPQLVSAFQSIVSGMQVKMSYILVYIMIYITFFIFIKLFYKKISDGKQKSNNSIVIFLSLVYIYYLHRPFHDLYQGAFSLLGFIIIFYILNIIIMENRKKELSLLPFYIVLLLAHSISVYFMIMLLSTTAILFLINKYYKHTKNLITLIIIVFSLTYFYNLITGIFARLIYEAPERLSSLLKSFFIYMFNRPISSSIKEQSLHYVYEYNHIFTKILYTIPIFLLFSFIIKQLYGIKSNKKTNIVIFSSLLFSFIIIGVSLLFAFYGIENYISRYLYWYGATLFPIIFVYYIRHSNRVFKITLLLSLFILISFVTEPFFNPWFSLHSFFDDHQFSIFYKLNILDFYYNNFLLSNMEHNIHISSKIFFNIDYVQRNTVFNSGLFFILS